MKQRKTARSQKNRPRSENMDASEILSMSLEEAYNLLAMIRENPQNLRRSEIEAIYQKARYGDILKFDIYDVFQENIKQKSKSGVYIIKGKRIPSTEFYSEIERRSSAIREALIRELCEGDILAPRRSKGEERWERDEEEERE